jgi:hypothetical protein
MEDVMFLLTRIPQTKLISSAVGAMRKIIACNMKDIPLWGKRKTWK